ncbi:MAG: hypothetical protein AAF998_25685 [Bacteroidota bacterium]
MLRTLRILTALIGLGWGLGFTGAPGQGCCTGGVPVSGNLGLPAGAQGTWQFQLSVDHKYLDALFDGRERLVDELRRRSTTSFLLEGSYGIRERLAVSGLLTFVRQTRRIEPAFGAVDFTENAGLGDAILLLRYNLLTDSVTPFTDLVLGIGPKFPLGRTDYPSDLTGILLPADLQPGTGAWDAVFWGMFSHTGIIRDRLTLLVIPSFRRTGTNQRYNGSQAYRFGNELQVNFGISDRWALGGLLLQPQLMFRWRATAPDQAEGQIVSNTGGRWLNVQPGVALGFSPALSLRLNAEIPIYRNLTGTQLTTTGRGTAALYYSFSTQNSTTRRP